MQIGILNCALMRSKERIRNQFLEFEHNFVIVIYNIFSISANGILFSRKKIAFFTKLDKHELLLSVLNNFLIPNKTMMLSQKSSIHSQKLSMLESETKGKVPTQKLFCDGMIQQHITETVLLVAFLFVISATLIFMLQSG